jgi:hypothetical protein
LPRERVYREGYAYRDTDRWEGFIKYAVEMGSGAMMYIPNFIKTGSGIHELTGNSQTHRHTDRMEIALPCFYFVKIRKQTK